MALALLVHTPWMQFSIRRFGCWHAEIGRHLWYIPSNGWHICNYSYYHSTVIVIGLVVFVIIMTDCRYGLSAPEEASESGPASAIDEEADGDDAAAGASGRRHLSAKERKLMKKQVSAELHILKVGLSASKTKPPQGSDGST